MTRTYRRCPYRGCWVGMHYWTNGCHTDNWRPVPKDPTTMALCLGHDCSRTRKWKKHAVFVFRTGRHAPVLHRDGAWCDARGQNIPAKRIQERRSIRHANRINIRLGSYDEADPRTTDWLD